MRGAWGTSSCLSEWEGFQVCDCEGGLLRPALRFLACCPAQHPALSHAYSGTPALFLPQTFFLPEAARGWDLAGLKRCGTCPRDTYGLLSGEKDGELRDTSCFWIYKAGSAWDEREGI